MMQAMLQIAQILVASPMANRRAQLHGLRGRLGLRTVEPAQGSLQARLAWCRQQYPRSYTRLLFVLQHALRGQAFQEAASSGKELPDSWPRMEPLVPWLAREIDRGFDEEDLISDVLFNKLGLLCFMDGEEVHGIDDIWWETVNEYSDAYENCSGYMFSADPHLLPLPYDFKLMDPHRAVVEVQGADQTVQVSAAWKGNEFRTMTVEIALRDEGTGEDFKGRIAETKWTEIVPPNVHGVQTWWKQTRHIVLTKSITTESLFSGDRAPLRDFDIKRWQSMFGNTLLNGDSGYSKITIARISGLDSLLEMEEKGKDPIYPGGPENVEAIEEARDRIPSVLAVASALYGLLTGIDLLWTLAHEIENLADWYHDQHPDLSKTRLSQALEAAHQRDYEEIVRGLEGQSNEFGQPVQVREQDAPLACWSDGALLVELGCPQSLSAEGKSMDHCVGDYWGEVRSGTSLVVSYRGGPNEAPWGTPEATFELVRTDTDVNLWSVRQIRGPHNRKIESATTKGRIAWWLKSLRRAGKLASGTAGSPSVEEIDQLELKDLLPWTAANYPTREAALAAQRAYERADARIDEFAPDGDLDEMKAYIARDLGRGRDDDEGEE
jgi:hypothetical protein